MISLLKSKFSFQNEEKILNVKDRKVKGKDMLTTKHFQIIQELLATFFLKENQVFKLPLKNVLLNPGLRAARIKSILCDILSLPSFDRIFSTLLQFSVNQF